MATEFITTIAVNLGILLLVSWVLGFVIFIRLIKDKHSLEVSLSGAQKAIKKLKQALKTSLATPTPEFPLEPVVVSDDEANLDLLNAIDLLSSDLAEKEQHLALLAQLHGEQQALLENRSPQDGNSTHDTILANHQKAQMMIESLQVDLATSHQKIKNLENQLRDNKDKDSRISILEEKENNLQDRIAKLKKTQEHAKQLAYGLRKANDKNNALRKDNEKLKRNIKELANASEEQRQTIQKITTELDKVAKLEQHQRDIINVLKGKLRQEKRTPDNTKAVNELEQKLQDVSETLERTLREKEFIESHLLEMDKSLEQAKETEAALERARKEIETLEMYFPEFDPKKVEGAPHIKEDLHEPLQTLSISAEEDPELFNIVSDNRLFGIVNEFWMTLDAPPLQLVSETDVKRPKTLTKWVKTSIHKDQFFVTIGATNNLIKILAEAMFKKTDHPLTEGEMQDALGELGNVLAGTLANELDPEFVVGISEHIATGTIEDILKQSAIAAESLLTANNEPIYLTLAKPTT